MASKKIISKSKKAAAKKTAGKSAAGKVVKKAAPKKVVKKAPAKKAPAKKVLAGKASSKKEEKSKKGAKKISTVSKKTVKKAAKKQVVKKTLPAVKKANAVSKKATPKKEKKAVLPQVKKVETKKVSKVVKAVSPAPKRVLEKPVQKAKATARPVVQIPVVPSVKIESKPMIEKKTETEVKKVVTTQRYNDADLAEFKVLVVKKLEEARLELVNLQAQIINTNENGTDDTGASFKMLEDGSETLAKEEAANLAARQKKFIEQLEAALVRIENKTYGICRVTGQLIPKERLRAVPHTTQSMEAKLKQYRD